MKEQDWEKVYLFAEENGVSPVKLGLAHMDHPEKDLKELVEEIKAEVKAPVKIDAPELSAAQQEQRRAILEGSWQPTKQEIEHFSIEQYARWYESGVGMKKEPEPEPVKLDPNKFHVMDENGVMAEVDPVENPPTGQPHSRESDFKVFADGQEIRVPESEYTKSRNQGRPPGTPEKPRGYTYDGKGNLKEL
jgi:hypothetical protein